ncbi:hypothetical protein [Marinobacter sp. DS40M6]|uniref:hypothetical protein n=1 Tax=Marinobacter sp. DS40M6 TaxID=1597776 RepID=UPI002358572D|nr:hypothetical protein [Marinobacter sp. DS40M6]MDC8457807.1 hypothetical protein [Marinobacter sp. DS40M6]
MPNNQAHDPRVVDPLDRVASAVGLSVAALESSEQVTILEQSNFDSGSAPNNWFVSTKSGGSIDFSGGFARGQYPITAGNPDSHVNISVPIPYGVRKLYTSFWARMPGNMGGCKFYKVQGIDDDPAGVANVTFGTKNNTGIMSDVSYGDGSTTGNDTQNTFEFTGSGHSIGRNSDAVILTPQGRNWTEVDWGTDWHFFRTICGYNSGNSAATEKPDGEFYVEIDGLVFLHATKLFNRHYDNGPIEKVVFFNAAQNDNNPFTVDFDDIKIATGGFAQ